MELVVAAPAFRIVTRRAKIPANGPGGSFSLRNAIAIAGFFFTAGAAVVAFPTFNAVFFPTFGTTVALEFTVGALVQSGQTGGKITRPDPGCFDMRKSVSLGTCVLDLVDIEDTVKRETQKIRERQTRQRSASKRRNNLLQQASPA